MAVPATISTRLRTLIVADCSQAGEEQDVPLRVKDVGLAVLPVCVAWKPMPTEVFGATAAL